MISVLRPTSNRYWKQLRERGELCEAHDAVVSLKDGNALVLQRAPRPDRHTEQMAESARIGRPAALSLIEKPVHVRDIYAEAMIHRWSRTVARSLDRMRTLLRVPLLREGEPIGAIVLSRQDRCSPSTTSRSRCSRPSPTRR